MPNNMTLSHGSVTTSSRDRKCNIIYDSAPETESLLSTSFAMMCVLLFTAGSTFVLLILPVQNLLLLLLVLCEHVFELKNLVLCAKFWST